MICASLFRNGWSCDTDIDLPKCSVPSASPRFSHSFPLPPVQERRGILSSHVTGKADVRHEELDCPVVEDTVPTESWVIFPFTTTDGFISFHLMNSMDLRSISSSGHQFSMETLRKMI